MEEGKNSEREVGKTGLTIEKLKTFKGFESVSEDEAAKIIYSIKEFSIIAYHYYLDIKKRK